MRIYGFASRHRVESSFLVAVIIGTVYGLTNPSLWMALLVWAPISITLIVWMMLGEKR